MLFFRHSGLVSQIFKLTLVLFLGFLSHVVLSDQVSFEDLIGLFGVLEFLFEVVDLVL